MEWEKYYYFFEMAYNVTGVYAVGRLRSVLSRSKWPMERNDTGKYSRLQLLFLVLILVTETK